MLNFLALSIGFFASIFILLPPRTAKNPEVKGVKIASLPLPYYPSPTPQETLALVLSDDISPSPTSKPIPTNSPTPTATPIPIQTSNPSTFIMNQINQYRVSKGLAPFETHSLVCTFAQTRVGELQNNFDHEGFDSRVNNNNLPYPNYTKVSENIADSSSYTKVFSMWQNSPSHNQNLLSTSPFACIAGSGRYFVFESWTP